jgi:hypothetical protein
VLLKCVSDSRVVKKLCYWHSDSGSILSRDRLCAFVYPQHNGLRILKRILNFLQPMTHERLFFQ